MNKIYPCRIELESGGKSSRTYAVFDYTKGELIASPTSNVFDFIQGNGVDGTLEDLAEVYTRKFPDGKLPMLFFTRPDTVPNVFYNEHGDQVLATAWIHDLGQTEQQHFVTYLRGEKPPRRQS